MSSDLPSASHAASVPGPRHSTPTGDRVSWRERIGFGLGGMCAEGSIGTLNLLINPIFNMVLGLSPALISTLLFVQRVWDALLDPLIGQYSDNYRSRWGRRLPLIAVGAPLTALLFAAIWWFPREATHGYLFGHLLVGLLLFYVAHTFLNMPLLGLRIEATGDYHERTRLAAIVMVFGFVMQITSQWVFPLTQLDIFGDTLTGLRWVTAASALLFLFAGLAPIFLCRERAYVTVAGKQPKIGLGEALRGVRADPLLLRVVAARFVGFFCYSMVGIFGVYMNTYYVFGGDLKRAAWAYGLLGSGFMAAAILGSAFLYPWLSRRVGKKKTFQIAAGILLVGCAAKLVIYHPGYPWLQFIVLGANGLAISGIKLMGASMIADIADQHEWRTGRRNEAFLAAIMNWFDKMGNSVGGLLSGFILVWAGFDAALGAQTPGTLAWMKFSYFITPFVGGLFALFMMRGYDLDEERVYRLKDELGRRRAVSAESAP